MRNGIGEYLTMAGNMSGVGATAIERPMQQPGPPGFTSIDMRMARAIDMPARTPMVRRIMHASPMVGALGQTAEAIEEQRAGNGGRAALLIGVAIAGLALRGVAGYFAGKAMAPSDDKETAYAWGGALASMFFGTLGLGVEGAIALSARK